MPIGFRIKKDGGEALFNNCVKQGHLDSEVFEIRRGLKRKGSFPFAIFYGAFAASFRKVKKMGYHLSMWLWGL